MVQNWIFLGEDTNAVKSDLVGDPVLEMRSFRELQVCKKGSFGGAHSPNPIFSAGISHCKNGSFLGSQEGKFGILEDFNPTGDPPSGGFLAAKL